MRVAVVSNRNVPGSPEQNAADHLAWVGRVAGKGARLVLFPELSLSGFSSKAFIRELGMSLDDRWPQTVVKAAREHGIFVAFGMPLRKGKRLFICQVLAGPDGLLGHYEKVRLGGGRGGEGRVFSPGNEFKVFDVERVHVGINICADGRHPGSSLCLAHLGAEVILHPHGNTVGLLGKDPRDWTAKKRAYLGPRAFDTCTYSLICNSVGSVRDKAGDRVHYSGGAPVLDPEGRFVARSPSVVRRPHMVVADMDIDELRRIRPDRPISARRPEVYVKALTRG